jgi:hypothetical protein
MGTKKDILTRGPLSNDRYIEEFDPRLVKRLLYELQHLDNILYGMEPKKFLTHAEFKAMLNVAKDEEKDASYSCWPGLAYE